MLEELRPLSISSAAKQLGVDVFEVVRLLVASGEPPADLRLSPDQVAKLRAFGGIEASWWTGAELPQDEHPLRQRVRATLGQMLSKGLIGATSTRMDNTWRGLPGDEQGDLQLALTTLGEEGVLTVVSTRTGVRISIAADRVDAARDLAAGTSDTPGLADLYQE